LSIFQKLQRRLGAAAGEIPEPTIGFLPLESLSEPTIGWLPESDYDLNPPRDFPVVIKPFASPEQQSLGILQTSPCISPPLGEFPRTAVGSEFHVLESLAIHAWRDAIEQRTATTVNLNQPLRMLRALGMAECLAMLFGRAVVSDDLHEPLVRAARAGGKHYAEEPRPKKVRRSAKSMEGMAIILEDAGRLKRGQAIRHNKAGANIWDLLLPLMQPPLDSNFGRLMDMPIDLYGYQVKGVEFLLDNASVLLGDDMGTGKTVQTAVAVRVLFQAGKIRTALIVCPLSVIPNWKRELEKLTKNLIVTVVRGDKERRKNAWRQPSHVWLTTYETLRNDLEDVQVLRKGRFDLVVVDEAQRIKNRSAGVSQAVREVRAGRRWGLTGTPLENRLDDVLAIFDFIKPELFPAGDYHATAVQSGIKPFFLRRRKQDVLTELPPLVEHLVWLQMEDEQRRSYEEMEKTGVLELHAKGETLTAQSVIVLINRLKQICNRCPRTGESAKLIWLRERLEEIVAEGDKVLVFTQYKVARLPGTEWLEQELAEFGVLNFSGATSETKRTQILSAFKEDATKRIFVGHPKTAGLGLNELIAANYVVHFDHWWNPAVMNQATARAHRPGQTKTVFAYDLWMEGTYEDDIYQILKEKQGLYDQVVDSISARREVDGSLAFAMANRLFQKYGLKPSPRIVK
jgi:superfamily II DNA or RNA helicase